MSNPILDWLEKRKVHRELLARWDALEKQAREGVTEKLKSDIEQLRDDIAKEPLFVRRRVLCVRDPVSGDRSDQRRSHFQSVKTLIRSH
jgi:hypothetical protein